MKDLEIVAIDIEVKEEDEMIDVVALGHALNELFYVKEENDDKS